MNKIKFILAFLIISSCGSLYAANVNNYFQQAGAGTENTLIIGGTQTVTGSLIVSGTQTVTGTLDITGTSSFDGDLVVSSITITNTATAGTLTDSTATLTAGAITGLLNITSSSGTITNLLTAGTVDTGNGATEIYDMDQDVLTTSDITFATATITTKLICSGNFNLPSFVVMTDSGTVTVSSSTVILATKAGAMEIDLPDAATSDGKIFTIKKTDADASIIALDANGGTVDGADPYNEIDAQYDFVTIISDGTNWHIVGKYITP